MITTIKKFKVGKSYSMHSACDHNCVWVYKVIARTESTVVLQQVRNGKAYGEKARFRIKKNMTEYLKVEAVMPLGSYSMAPVLKADC